MMNTASTPATTKRKNYWVPTILLASTGFMALTAVPIYGIVYGYHWYQWLAFLVITSLCGLSITAGNHRLWTHRTYEAHWLLRLLFSLFSAATLQNTTLNWCSEHRRHHRYTDDNEHDPHSSARGLWFSHIDWMLHEHPSGKKDYSNVPDLKRDEIVMWQHKNYLPITLGMNFSICLILGLITGDILAMFLLAGVLRIAVNHHSAFIINSIGHYWGQKKYKSDVSARDNPLINIFCFGEGYHNYHHAFQTDYRTGIRWYQYDPSKWLIKGLSWFGITKQLRAASELQIRKAMQEVAIEQVEQQLKKLATQNQRYWRELLQRERLDFCEIFDRWQALMTQRRAIDPDSSSAKWKLATIQTQIRELKFRLKMQSARLRLLMRQLPLNPVTAG
ncbi:fatty acid desaturase [Microbulbifer variabilis]|uniref:fatty acid desaturase n=1 Tax=Microbulbifer variabilis TaxID=266805 RepID=UPI001CFD1DE8|nr:fatty acid desaturase [Microbulbifer variabilis]